MRSVAWWTTAPQIVAESLVAVTDPLLTVLQPGPAASGQAVVSSLCASLALAEDAQSPPSWLYPEQVRSFRRILASLRSYGGAILADPVGSGKTYIALAVATAVNRGPTACLVPATLLPQWQQAAERLHIPIVLCSHEQASRGRHPQGTRGLIIIDESHHFRNPGTRRYIHVARWVMGRPALLVTATPVVNRVTDLVHQLLLSVRDDALVLNGIVSLRTILAGGGEASALGQVVIESDPVSERRPGRLHRTSRPGRLECAAASRQVDLLARLRLSRSPSIAALLRSVFLRAAGSSPAALEGSLRRYRRLLLHASDALVAGHPMDRSELQHFTGASGDQLLWWELMPEGTAESEIELADLAEIDAVILAVNSARPEADGKLGRLRDILSDGTPALIFTGGMDTVRYLRDRLADLRPAWCTGVRAGIGPTTMPRGDVLRWFREDRSSRFAPCHLIVTDVAAEGLDLQRAARVVHYDLPWTPMRLEQREGRAVRYGSSHAQVEVVRFLLPRAIERSLRLERTLLGKARLPSSVGLGPGGRQLWRWRSELADRWTGPESIAGTARVTGPHQGLLAGFALREPGESSPWLSANLIWLEPGGRCSEAPEALAGWLGLAAVSAEIVPVDAQEIRRWLTLLAGVIRDRVALARGRRWLVPNPSPGARRLAARLQLLIRDAARLHKPDRLGRLERAMDFVAGGHTSGEEALVQELADADDRQILSRLHRMPEPRRLADGLEVQLTGLVVFGPA
ncbi:MAG: helicase-related protein [Gemmatimonadales bacterium]